MCNTFYMLRLRITEQLGTNKSLIYKKPKYIKCIIIHRAHSAEGVMDTFTSYYKQFIILFVKTNKTNQLQIAVFNERQDQGG